MMKRLFRQSSVFVLLLLGATMLFSSCRALKGDPRKNCNHPQHGVYMKEQFQKKTGF